MAWNKILGQIRVKKIILEILQQRRIPNAFLFYGNEGVGKDAVAIHLAKVLNCDKTDFKSRVDNVESVYDSCDDCYDCINFNKLQHPNFKIIFALPRGKNEKEHDDNPLDKLSADDINNIKNEIANKAENYYYKIKIPGASEIRLISIRELRRYSYLSTNNDKYRVILLTNAHEMNTEASNAFLKLLEEPPNNTLFILTTSKKENILPTIYSRCQDLFFDDLSESEIDYGLQKYFNVTIEKSKIIAQLANGSFARAIELLDENFNEMRNNVVNLLRLILSNKFPDIYEEIDNLISEKDRIKLEYKLILLISWLRDIILLREGLSGKIVNVDQLEALNSFYQKLPRAKVMRAIEQIENSILLIQKNVNIQLIVYNLIINLRNSILL
jgi:DNA polymerase-3 subunit delta'